MVELQEYSTKGIKLINKFNNLSKKNKTIIIISGIFFISLNILLLIIDDEHQLDAMQILIELFKLLITLL